MTIDPGRGTWIAAAALDRYLKMTKHPTIFGLDLAPDTPFDAKFMPDYIRIANCVPSGDDRQRMIDAFAKQQPLPAVDPCTNFDVWKGTWSITIQKADG